MCWCAAAGADISMLEKVQTAAEARELSKACQDLLAELEASKKPYVSAIMGSCLGGGLEVSRCQRWATLTTSSCLRWP